MIANDSIKKLVNKLDFTNNCNVKKVERKSQGLLLKSLKIIKPKLSKFENFLSKEGIISSKLETIFQFKSFCR